MCQTSSCAAIIYGDFVEFFFLLYFMLKLSEVTSGGMESAGCDCSTIAGRRIVYGVANATPFAAFSMRSATRSRSDRRWLCRAAAGSMVMAAKGKRRSGSEVSCRAGMYVGSLARRRDGRASDPIPHVERTLGLAHGVGMRARPGIERGKRLVERAPERRHRVRHPGRRTVDDAPFHDPVALEAPHALRQRLLRHAGDLAS